MQELNMGLVEEILGLWAGNVIETDSVVRIEHQNGDYSHLYRRRDAPYATDVPAQIRYIYDEFDGVDILSSAFKISPIANPSAYGGVRLFSSADELVFQMSDIQFRERVLPFCNETGNWIYAASYDSRLIFRFDVETGVITEHPSFREVLGFYADAIR
ncbi:hypothetical protein [Allohahella marinimesophila]|uniref:Uncharacterized protein n=1 Tax=Allohahella marinimesophila TaxID=1054972 RepID=A0ABP7QC62_9GAMM